jgi:acyl carrier protein
MLSNIETFLFKQFPNQPLWVRALAYLVLLGVFVYLILIPRFIDGQLVVKDPSTGGLIPYRGANIQMQVDGRDYKFKSNEGGYFSIPIVSKLPSPVEFQVFHEDKAQWFKVKFTAIDAWGTESRQVEISNNTPYVQVASLPSTDATSMLSSIFNQLGLLNFPNAYAGELVVPSPSLAESDNSVTEQTGTGAPLAQQSQEDTSVRITVTQEISKVLGKTPDQIDEAFPLIGDQAPSYVLKIQIIEKLEQDFELKIPDEHWKVLTNVGELVNYIQQRNLLQQRFPSLQTKSDDWPTIQQSLPSEQRPVFR